MVEHTVEEVKERQSEPTTQIVIESSSSHNFIPENTSERLNKIKSMLEAERGQRWKKNAIIIGCSEYANLRRNTNKTYRDLPESLEDLKVVKHGLKRLKFRQNEIKMLTNPNYNQISAALDLVHQ